MSTLAMVPSPRRGAVRRAEASGGGLQPPQRLARDLDRAVERTIHAQQPSDRRDQRRARPTAEAELEELRRVAPMATAEMRERRPVGVVAEAASRHPHERVGAWHRAALVPEEA